MVPSSTKQSPFLKIVALYTIVSTLTNTASTALLRRVEGLKQNKHYLVRRPCYFISTSSSSSSVVVLKRRKSCNDFKTRVIFNEFENDCTSCRLRVGQQRQQQQQQLSSLSRRRICIKATSGKENDNEEEIEEDGDLIKKRQSKREIAVCASIDLPFPASVAYDAFSDLSRQPSWSPMIRSVEYLDDMFYDDGAKNIIVAGDDDDDNNNNNNNQKNQNNNNNAFLLPVTEWTMGTSGFKFSWKAVSKTLQRPNCIEWESISGLKNMGKVDFVEIVNNDYDDDDDSSSTDSSSCVVDSSNSQTTTTTRMTLSMTFFAPRVISGMFRRSNKLSSYVEKSMIMETLTKFRDVVLEEDLDLMNRPKMYERETEKIV